MKQKTLLILLVFTFYFLLSPSAHAVYVQKMPVNQIQPSGDTLHFFVTGDECYHRFHDADNYTIVQNRAGYWVYAVPAPNGGIQPSQYLVGKTDLSALGIKPGLRITRNEWLERRQAWVVPEQYRVPQPKTSGRNHGDFCNLVIFIRFADDSAYTRSLSSIDNMWSDSTTSTSTSVYNYFKYVSYNKLFVRTYYAPTPDSNTILSYQSPHPRAYYLPYTESNTLGYSNYDERTEREFELLVGAVNYINDSAPVPQHYNLDCDNDGYIDNVNFVVKGTYTGWNDLLWPHKWNLYGQNVFINGKQVSTFNFALEGAGADYFGPSTFCHEMFHSLGAPDLYRYNEGTEISPVGPWDLMATNSKPPQHMSAYMKYKYGNWIDSIPTITTPGTYTINSVADSVPGTNIYRIPSSDTNQFYIVEYRDNTETFETTLPGKGLLVYRIDKRFNGNAGFNGEDVFDEVWLFRPESSDNRTNGQLGNAYFSTQRSRTEFSPSSNPYPYLSDGTRDYSISITLLSSSSRTLRFKYTNHTKPADLALIHATTSTASLRWGGNADAYRVRYRKQGSSDPFTQRLVHTSRITLLDLEPNTHYEWTVRSLYASSSANDFTDSSNLAQIQIFHTEICNNATVDSIGEDSHDGKTGIPFTNNELYNYSQQIFLASELDGPKNINSISFKYAYSTPLVKDNCTIYMANTQIAEFSIINNIVPPEELTQVYTGSITFSQGWNEIILDSSFFYNGTDNLVIAIDDNSSEPARPADHFYINYTNSIMAVCYHSYDHNVGPDVDSITGTRTTRMFRDNIRISGCPVDSQHFYLYVISDNDNLGRVAGSGYYDPGTSINIYAFPNPDNTFLYWNDGNTDNPRNVLLVSDTLFIAFFHSPLGIGTINEDAGYIIATHSLGITVHGAERQPINIYDVMGRHIANAPSNHPADTRFDLPAAGIYLVKVGQEKPVKILVR